MLVARSETFGELKVDGSPHLDVEEDTEDVQTVQDNALFGGQDQIYGLGVDCRSVGALFHVTHGVHLRLEVHLAVEQVTSVKYL